MKHHLFIFPLILIYNIVWAQTSISGRVTNQGNKPLPFATVILQQNGNFITGTTSDDTGNFQLLYAYVHNTAYSIRFSLVGYEPVTKHFIYPDTSFFKRVVLTTDKKTLSGITVTARKPMVIRKADRYIIDVENSFLADGHSGLGVLQKSPGIWVGNNGSIRIRGSQPVLVMINDVVQRMSEGELAEYLKTLKSEDISRIEVIPTPPAEFEAAGSGGIIHIVLKKARKDGLNGAIYTQYRQQGKQPYVSAGTTLNYKVKDYYLFGSYSYTKDKSEYLATTDILYPDKSIYNSRTDRKNDIGRQQYRLGIAYDLNGSQSVGIQTIGTLNRSDQSFLTGINFNDGNLPTTGAANSYWWRQPALSSTTLNYSWKIDSSGSLLKAIVDYTSSSKKETNNFSSAYNLPEKNSTYRNNTPNTTDIYNIQADYTRVLKNKMEIKAGAKYSAIKRDNKIIREDYTDNNWVVNAAGSNHFIYNEELSMVYTSFERSIKQTSIKAGIRAEHTYTRGNSITSGQRFSRSYFGLFPSLFIMQSLSKGNSLYINYSRRLQRPAFNELNPYRLQFDDYTVQIGNPDLLPQYTHNVSLGYSFLDDYSADLYFSKTSNIIAQLANPVGNNIIEYQYQNFDNSMEYGFNFSAPLRVLEGWTANNSFSFYRLSYRINSFEINQVTFSAKSIHTITLKNWVNIEAGVDYRSPYVNANARVPYMFSFDLGFTKRILKSRGRLLLYFEDIFNTLREQDVTDYNNTHIAFYQKRPTRVAGLSFTYNFNIGKKFDNKKIDQGSSNEEKSRIGN